MTSASPDAIPAILRHRTPSGLDVPLVAGPQHHSLANEGLPGQSPFTRGIFSDGYTGRLWTMRQYSGFGTSEESNARYKFLLESGQTGLSVALDLPTQCGYDPDDPIAGPEVGKVGVSLSNLSGRPRRVVIQPLVTPTALKLKAQGCRAATNLGSRRRMGSTESVASAHSQVLASHSLASLARPW